MFKIQMLLFKLLLIIIITNNVFAKPVDDIMEKFFDHAKHNLLFNSSNPNKRSEYKRLFQRVGFQHMSFSNIETLEPNSTIETIIRYKASQMNEDFILVEDTSIEIEGRKDTGVHIKHFLKKLKKNPKLIFSILGKKVIITVLIAFKSGNHIIVSKGQIYGRIDNHAPPCPIEHLGQMILPGDSNYTYAESESLSLNPKYSARALAVKNLINKKVNLFKNLHSWHGTFQK
jgi:inosine/xanthosine triphosphate pyrophosphatase family protein